MADTPIRERKFHAFLSHAHADKAVVDVLYAWLKERCGIPVWYDTENLSASSEIVSNLPDAILQCRGVILVVSADSVKSGWVREEYGLAVAQRAAHSDFRILPIRLDDCEMPGFLTTTKWIDLSKTSFSPSTALRLIQGLYYGAFDFEIFNPRDVYVTRTWRDTNERALADSVCQMLIDGGFRLIGDAEDQQNFDEARISRIMASCGAYAAILPDRGQGQTSRHMLREMELAGSAGLASLVVAEDSVNLAEPFCQSARRVPFSEARNGTCRLEGLAERVSGLKEEWQRPSRPSYVFLGASFGSKQEERNRILKSLVECVTAMPCLLGESILEGPVQSTIVERIQLADVVIADISEDNLNTCIEAGIARGASRSLHLISKAPRRRPPFMFRDQQVWFYADDLECMGIVHRITHAYRRRVLDWELAAR